MKNKHFVSGIACGLMLFAQAGRTQDTKQTPPAPATTSDLRTPPTGKMPDNVPPAIARFLKQRDAAKTLSFQAQLWYHKPDDLDKIRTGQSLDVQIRRPNLFAVHVSPGEKYETYSPTGTTLTFLNMLESASISDGKSRLTLLSPRVGQVIYSTDPGSATYSESSSEALQRIIPDAALMPNALVDYAPAPDAQLGLSPVAVYAYIRDVTPAGRPKAHEEDFVLYFSKATGELMRWSYFDLGPGDKREEFERVEYGDWKFNPRLPASTFSVKPPTGAIPASSIPIPGRKATPTTAITATKSKM